MDAILAVPFYKDKNRLRNNELLQCLIHNCNASLISHIVLVCDEDIELPVKHDKIIVVNNGQRPSYTDMFNIVNAMNGDWEMLDMTYRIVANADIYFTDEMLELIHTSLEKDQCYALSRWDVTNDGLIHHCTWDSQDAWVFKGKVRKGDYDFLLGKPGCDNRIAAELKTAGYELLNPSKTIQTYHLHKTGVRNYTRDEGEVVPRPYEFVTPTFLGEKHYRNYVSDRRKDLPPTIKLDDSGNIKYDFDAQKQMMAELAQKRTFKNHRLLTIAIPTLDERREMFDELKAELDRQIWDAGLMNEVEIRPFRDRGTAPIGWKRNHICIQAHGKYIVHFDDDDWPSANYVKEIVSALKGNPGVDCVTFNAEVTYDGVNPELMIYNQCYKTNEQHNGNGATFRTRMPSHINVIKRSIALMHPFKVIMSTSGKNDTRKSRGDNGSDVTFSVELVNNGSIKTSVHIGEVLYHYRYSSNK